MQFRDVIGQESVKQHLREMVEHNRLSHALLFLGKEGSGALPLALAFAQYIICHKVANAAPAGPSLFGDAVEPLSFPMDACGECPACTKAAGLVHPDVHFTFPVITKKAGQPPLSADYITDWRDIKKINGFVREVQKEKETFGILNKEQGMLNDEVERMKNSKCKRKNRPSSN